MAKKSQKKSPSEALIQKGFNYENDKEMLFKRSEKRAWQVNIVLVVLLFMSFGGYFFLLPLKEVKPYLLGFDSSTGIVDPITTVSEEVIEANDALDKHFINQYLSLRESYIYETITNTYELTQLFSNANVAKQFREEYNQADSLDNLLGTGSAKVKVNSITLEEINDKKLAIARIKVSYRNAKNESYSKDYTVRLSYIYEPSTKLQLSHRIDNPVGFFVTSYQKLRKIFNEKLLLFSILISLIPSVNAEVIPKGSRYDSRMKTVSYNPYDVTKIDAKTGYATSIVFNENEVVLDISVGFNEGWEVVDSRNVVYLKPVSLEQDGYSYDPWPSDWATNLVIKTNLNLYAFDLNLVDSKKNTAYIVEFNYPLEEKKQREAKRVAEIAKHNENMINKQLDELTYPANWNYSMKVAADSDNIKPVFAYDDGTRTYLGFNQSSSIPAVFYYQGEQEMMSNTNVKEIPNYTIVVIHKTADRFILRSGEQTVGIINSAYGYNVPPQSKATEPKIIRGIK